VLAMYRSCEWGSRSSVLAWIARFMLSVPVVLEQETKLT
jgi:hypothetical protein